MKILLTTKLVKSVNTEDSKRLGFKVRQKQKTLPIMYWFPKIHKDVRGLNNINEKIKSILLQYMTFRHYTQSYIMIN